MSRTSRVRNIREHKILMNNISTSLFSRDSFAYEKLRTKRQNKHGCYLLRESHTNYDDFYLDVCMAEDGEPATTFSIVKSTDGLWTFAGLNSQPCSSVRELLITQGNVKHLGIPGFELKECLPSSENGKY